MWENYCKLQKTHGINIPSMNEVEISRCLRHESKETPTTTPMRGNANPYWTWQHYRFPRYFSLFLVDKFTDIVQDVIFLIIRDSRMLLWCIVYKKIPKTIPMIYKKLILFSHYYRLWNNGQHSKRQN